MPRNLQLNRDRVSEGTALWLQQLGELSDAALDEPSGLPGWRRRELVAHVSANAQALGNLVSWAATGVESPMYASPEERAQGITTGAALPAAELRAAAAASAQTLQAAMDGVAPENWTAEVRTAQGRLVSATEIPWLRAREVMIHAVDLNHTMTFADLNPDFLAELGMEVADKRGSSWACDPQTGLAEVSAGSSTEPRFAVQGSLPDVTAWLTGRPFTGLTGQPDGIPQLDNWL